MEGNYSILEKQKLGVTITKALFFYDLQGEYEYMEVLDPDCFQGFVHHHHKE